jgi:Immunity protein 52
MFDVVSKFHVPERSPLATVRGAFEILLPLAKWLGAKDPSLAEWFLGGGSFEEAQRYQAFVDGINDHAACLAVLEAQYKTSGGVGILIWNGQNSPNTGASLSIRIAKTVFPSQVALRLGGDPGKPRIGDYKDTAEFLSMMVRGTQTECGFVYDESGYGNKQTFKDRPGVGWMLYLPRVFTPQELPEARALLPVFDGKERLGTIIVSVTDAVFDDNNPEHLQIARDIETRLVSNDWLPTWAQMTRRE